MAVCDPYEGAEEAGIVCHLNRPLERSKEMFDDVLEDSVVWRTRCDAVRFQGEVEVLRRFSCPRLR